MSEYGRFDLKYVRTDRNGTKYYLDFNCPRCSGYGQADKWKFTGLTCFECGGSGRRSNPKTIKEYTPEHLAKLTARRAEKWNMERADEIAKAEAERAEREAAEAQRKAEEEAERIRRAGKFIGEVGKKITVDVTYDYHVNFDTMYGISTVYNLKDADGNTLVWITGGTLTDKAGEPVAEGEKITIKGTIKEHKEYRGINQTILTRVKVI